jgi:hypothetical protein
MACDTATSPVLDTKSTYREILISYDSGYEHSVEHLLELRVMVEEAAREPVIKKRPLTAEV